MKYTSLCWVTACPVSACGEESPQRVTDQTN